MTAPGSVPSKAKQEFLPRTAILAPGVGVLYIVPSWDPNHDAKVADYKARVVARYGKATSRSIQPQADPAKLGREAGGTINGATPKEKK